MTCICSWYAWEITALIAFVFLLCVKGSVNIWTRGNAMRKRGLCCQMVSVCPSVTFVYRIQTAEDIVKLLYRPDIAPLF